MRFRYKVTGSSTAERQTVLLLQGATTRATVVNNATVTRNAWTQVDYTLTAGQADAITDYSDLRLRFTPGTLAAGETYRISWAVLEVPDRPPVTLAGAVTATSGGSAVLQRTLGLSGTAAATTGAVGALGTVKAGAVAVFYAAMFVPAAAAGGPVALSGSSAATATGAAALRATPAAGRGQHGDDHGDG